MVTGFTAVSPRPNFTVFKDNKVERDTKNTKERYQRGTDLSALMPPAGETDTATERFLIFVAALLCLYPDTHSWPNVYYIQQVLTDSLPQKSTCIVFSFILLHNSHAQISNYMR